MARGFTLARSLAQQEQINQNWLEYHEQAEQYNNKTQKQTVNGSNANVMTYSYELWPEYKNYHLSYILAGREKAPHRRCLTCGLNAIVFLP